MTVTVTAEELVARYPELHPIHCEQAGLLDSVLSEASAFVDHAAGSEAQVRAVIMAKAAQKIARLPCGRMAGFSDAKGSTPYDEDLAHMMRGLAVGIMVV